MFLAISVPALSLVRRPNDTMRSCGDNEKWTELVFTGWSFAPERVLGIMREDGAR